MRSRCNNPNSVPYSYYGAKGIRVCEEWDSSPDGFMNFNKWSMNHGYSDKLTIDRIDPDKGYSPENCRWADKHTQNANRNTKKNSSGYYGVSKHNNCDTWYGRVKVYGKTICTGTAKTAREAAIKRDAYIVSHGLCNKQNGVLNGLV